MPESGFKKHKPTNESRTDEGRALSFRLTNVWEWRCRGSVKCWKLLERFTIVTDESKTNLHL